MSTRPAPVPAPLAVAASLVAVEGLVLALLGVAEVGNLSSDRLSMGLTTTLFFVAYGVLLVLAAWAVSRRRSWARSPIVLTQLIMLGLAWNYRDVPALAGGLAVVAVLTLVGMLHPASLEALGDRPEV
ncbi:MAG: hypothetical protein ACXVWZ_00035 [Nocardioides sp.]